MVKAILYVLWTGCPWRTLPDRYPHWRTVHHHFFTHWAADGTLARLHTVLHGRVRAAAGRTVAPTAAIEVLPRRWVVERTFSWLGKCRRLAIDYGVSPSTPRRGCSGRWSA